MKRKEALPELLAPAGSFDCLVAAVAAGADAIYVGGRRFGARAFAKNFDLPELSEAVKYCSLHGVRLYVTLNTLIEDKEMDDAVEYARELWKIGVSAIIISDVGALSRIREAVPEMELHASTQMSVHSTLGADAAYSLGCKRVVLARELSLENIKSAVNNSKAEIEVFLHGALCVCHSGQCLFSSLVGGRSGNRGECAQPCRLPYSTPRGGEYPLSLKDLSLAEHIPALIDSGVASLKIEGRMKSAGYVYTVTKIYRRLLDEGRSATAEEMNVLRQAFSRGGFTDGYLKGKPDFGMLGIRSEGDKEESRKIDEVRISLLKKKVTARVKISLGKPAEMTLSDGNREITVYGDTPAAAQNQPLTALGVTDRLSKMGNTYLSLAPEDIELSLEDGVNLSPASLNGLRRLAAEKISDFTRREPVAKAKNEFPKTSGSLIAVAKGAKSRGEKPLGEKITTVELYSAEEYIKAANAEPELFSTLTAFVPVFSPDEAIRAAAGVILPAVILDSELADVKRALAKAQGLGANRAVAQNIAQISLLSDLGFEVLGGFRLNVTNARARAVYENLGAKKLILSPELTLPKARDVSGGTVTYGRIPLMLTERCFTKENFGCESCGKAAFTDRREERFPVMRESAHRNLILNSAVTYMGDKADELERAGLVHHHLLFTNESAKEIIFALKAHSRALPLYLEDQAGNVKATAVRRMGRREASSLPSDSAKQGRIVKNTDAAVASGAQKQPQNKKAPLGTKERGNTANAQNKTDTAKSVPNAKPASNAKSAPNAKGAPQGKKAKQRQQKPKRR